MDNWELRLYFFTAILCLSSAFQVYQQTAVNNVFPAIEAWLLSQYDGYTKDYAYSMWSTAVGSTIVGRLLGTVVGGYLADTLGRRRAFCLTSFFLTLSGIFSIFSKYGSKLWMLAINRQLVGIVFGSGTIVASLYIVECAPKALRGRMIFLQQIFRGLGEVLGFVLGLPQVLGTANLWPYLLAVGCLPGPVSLIFLYWTFPDSPRYLIITQGEEEAGDKAIVFYQGQANFEATRAEIRAEKKKIEDSKKAFEGSRIGRFKHSGFWKKLAIALILNTSVISTPVLMYSTYMLITLGMESATATYYSTSMGFARLLVSFGFMPFMDRYDMKSVAVVSILINTLGLVGIVIAAGANSATWSAIFMIGFIATGAVAYSAPRSLSLQLFDQADRSLANTAAQCFRYLITGLVGMTYITFQQAVGIAWSFAPLAAAGLLLAVMVIFMDTPDHFQSSLNEKTPLIQGNRVGPLNPDPILNNKLDENRRNSIRSG